MTGPSIRATRLIWNTWRGIGRRWWLPVSIVGLPLAWSERQALLENPTGSLALAAYAMSIVLVAPPLWRLCFRGVAQPRRHPLRFLAYVAGCVLTFYGLALPDSGWIGFKWMLTSFDPGVLLTVGALAVGGFVLARDVELDEGLRSQVARAEALLLEAQHAELLAIRAHLDPHFLFNTLNAIAEWCREDPAIAEKALLQLSDMLRTIFDGLRQPLWPLRDELRLLQALGDLHAIRDRGRYTLAMDAPPQGQPSIPPMLLLSVLENAYKHGPSAGHQGELRVSFPSVATGFAVEISNPGAFAGPRQGGEGLGLVKRRLELAYGPRGQFDIKTVGDRTVARVEIRA